jgi:hypothetical protein
MLIKITRSVHEELGAVAWVSLSVILLALIVTGVVALRWILHGGLACQSTQSMFPQRRKTHQLTLWNAK